MILNIRAAARLMSPAILLTSNCLRTSGILQTFDRLGR